MKVRAFNRNLWSILSLSITGDIIPNFDTPAEFFDQQIVLVQEQDYLGPSQDLIRDDLFPQFVRILKAVGAVVLEEFLVEDVDRGEEDDRIHVVKEWCPGGSR